MPDAPMNASMRAAPRGPMMAVTVIVAIAYLVAIHWSIVDHTMPSLTLMLIAAPWLIAIASACAKTIVGRPIARVVVTVGFFVAGTALVARGGSLLRDRVDALVYIENLIFMLSLAALFAISLIGPRDALITRLARMARRDDMPALVIRYTRRVTLAWALFFVAVAAISTVLYTTQSRETWSAFVNLALWPLTALAFGIEYAIRVRSLPPIDHLSPLASMRLFMQRDRFGVDTEFDADVPGPRREPG